MNKSGYNKFLEISKDVEVRISEEKILEDVRWDGLKGYVTKTDLPAEDVVAQYRGLWVVERAFRISKGTLDMRPMFHFNERRKKAHVCICFAAYKVYKELERIIAMADIHMSVDKVLDIARQSQPSASRCRRTMRYTPRPYSFRTSRRSSSHYSTWPVCKCRDAG